MPFSVLIIEKNLLVREELVRLFREQFSEEDDRVITIAEFDVAKLRNDQSFDLAVYRFPSEDFHWDELFRTLVKRSLFQALYYEPISNELENHMISCHYGNVVVEINEPDWGKLLAQRARVFLCNQLVNGGLGALFKERDYQRPASPYEGRFRRFLIHGRGLTHALAELCRTIEAYWLFLDERTRKRVEEQFHVDLDHEVDGQKYPVLVTLQRLPGRPS